MTVMMMRSPTGVDSDFDNFLSYLNTPTQTTAPRKKMISDFDARDVLVLPHVDAKKSLADARDDSATVSTTKSGGIDGDGDVQFDDFLSYLRGENANPTKKRTVEEVPNPSVDSLDGFLNYLDGGDVPPPPAPKPASRSVAPVAAASPAPILRRGKNEESVRASPTKKAKTVVDRHNLPVDYFVTLSAMEAEERARAMREMSEAVRPAAIAYFTRLGEIEAREKLAAHRALSMENMSVATKHFADIAEKDRRSSSSSNSVEGGELMPSAIAYFTLAQREVENARRAEIAEMWANPPPLPAAQEFFTSKDRELRAAKAAILQDLIDNPPPKPAAQEYFTRLAAERKAQLLLESQEPLPAAMEYFAMLDREEKARREATMRSIDDGEQTSVATRHFAELAAMKEEERRTRRTSIGSDVTPLEPVPIDYFVNLYKEEKDAKIRASMEGTDYVMPVATKHFHDLAKSRSNAEWVPNENMSVAVTHFHNIDAEKRAAGRSDSEGQVVEMMPVAMQRFTQAAREEKLARTSGSFEVEPIAIAHLHFTPSLRERLDVSSE